MKNPANYQCSKCEFLLIRSYWLSGIMKPHMGRNFSLGYYIFLTHNILQRNDLINLSSLFLPEIQEKVYIAAHDNDSFTLRAPFG